MNQTEQKEKSFDVHLSSWLDEMKEALLMNTGMDVPCGSCNACCRSSHFIHVTVRDVAALAAIPEALLFAAPGMEAGHRLMGYDAHGCCPMLVENKCSIYSVRPLTCRQYDCRIFAVAGLMAGGEEKRDVNKQVARWRLITPDDKSRHRLNAIRLAVAFITQHREAFPGGRIPSSPSELAVLAIKVHEVFLDRQELRIDKIHRNEIETLASAVVRAFEEFSAES